MTLNQLSARSREEERLYHDWVAGGKKPDQLRPLLGSLQPLVHKTVNKYRAADVAEPALHAHAENRLVQGLHTFDPNRGSSLSTHLNWQMRGVGRFVEKHQNFARIPGNRIRYIGKYQQAQSQLQDEMGEAPTWQQIARRSKVPRKHAQKLQTELNPVHISGMAVDPLGAPLNDAGGYTFSADMERLDLIYPDMTSPRAIGSGLHTGKKRQAPGGLQQRSSATTRRYRRQGQQHQGCHRQKDAEPQLG